MSNSTALYILYFFLLKKTFSRNNTYKKDESIHTSKQANNRYHVQLQQATTSTSHSIIKTDEEKQNMSQNENNKPVVCGWIICYLGDKIDSLREDNTNLQATKDHQDESILYLHKIVATQKLIIHGQQRTIGYQRLTIDCQHANSVDWKQTIFNVIHERLVFVISMIFIVHCILHFFGLYIS